MSERERACEHIERLVDLMDHFIDKLVDLKVISKHKGLEIYDKIATAALDDTGCMPVLAKAREKEKMFEQGK